MKKLLAALICISMFMGLLAGCSKSSDEKSNETVTAAPTSAAEVTKAVSDLVTQFDFSSVEKQTNDPSFPGGAYFFQEIKDIIGPCPIPDKEVKVGFIMKSLENEYWVSMYNGINEEVDRLKSEGYKITVDIRAGQTETDQEGQLAIMNDMVNKKYDVIVCGPISDSNLVPGIEAAQDAGIPVVTLSVAYDSNPYVPNFVGLSSYASGKAVAQYFDEKISDEGGEVAIIMGIANNPSARDRTAGFKAYIEENPQSNMKLVDIQNADWDRAKAKDVTDTLLKAHPDLKAIFCNNDTMALGSIESIKAADKVGQILVGGVDGTKEAIESIKKGEISCTCNQYSYYLGKVALNVAFRAMAGQEVPNRIWGPFGIIDTANADAEAADIINWTDLEYTLVK